MTLMYLMVDPVSVCTKVNIVNIIRPIPKGLQTIQWREKK